MESQMRMVTKEIENELHVVKMPQAHGRACLGDLKMIGMDGKKKIAIFALPVLTITMIGVFQAAKHLLGLKLAWYAGFWIYWPVWCVLYPSLMIGWRKMRDLFKHRNLTVSGWILMVFPPLMALVGNFLFVQKEQAASGDIVYILISFGNGIFEEMLWRGVYTTLFPDRKLWAVIWPSLWFALWRTAILEAVLYDVDLLKVDDGVYIGQHEYRNYMYRVQVEVSDNRITEVEIIDWEPNDARIKALEILDRVIEQQSLCVDAITGATTASKLYLLCLEDALPYHKSEKCSGYRTH
jgi:uncharacterized protein with FMN-binding domain